MLERLHKVLARAGVAALRPAEDMIMAGRVTVNGRTVRELGARVDPDTDTIAVDGQVIEVPPPSAPHRYIMVNKPTGVISTARDTHGRPTVVGLVPSDVRLFPVGRLDADSEGLLLLTDDGDLAYRLTHPRFEVEKEYRVLLDHTPTIEDLRRWRTGIEVEGEPTLPAWVEVLERTMEGTWVRVVMREGRKRQIREIARVLGYKMLRLIRVREGPLALGNLQPGEWRELTPAEVRVLQLHTRHIPAREAEQELKHHDGKRERLRPTPLSSTGRAQRPPRQDQEAVPSGASSRAPTRPMRSPKQRGARQQPPFGHPRSNRPSFQRSSDERSLREPQRSPRARQRAKEFGQDSEGRSSSSRPGPARPSRFNRQSSRFGRNASRPLTSSGRPSGKRPSKPPKERGRGRS
jgi:23S rRNA pseudouridine2605 synthase